MNRLRFQKSVLKLSEGLVSNFVDFILLGIFCGLELSSQLPTSRGATFAGKKAVADLEKINYQQIKNALRRLKENKLIDGNLNITQNGRKKAQSILPSYRQHQKWSGKWYLVVFDIPEKRKKDRETLRHLLQRLGFGRLQDSVWVSADNYLDEIKIAVDSMALTEFVIPAVTGQLGTEKAKVLARKIWRLEKINQSYQEFIKKYGKNKKIIDETEVIFEYLGILKEDPQLPKELLPPVWLGDKARKIYQNIKK